MIYLSYRINREAIHKMKIEAIKSSDGRTVCISRCDDDNPISLSALLWLSLLDNKAFKTIQTILASQNPVSYCWRFSDLILIFPYLTIISPSPSLFLVGDGR